MDDELKLRNLRDAVCEYLDEGELSEFLDALRAVLEQEEDDFLKKASVYKDARKKLFK